MASEAEPIELEESGKLCGHVFCSQCLRDSLRNTAFLWSKLLLVMSLILVLNLGLSLN
ncbi:unnamed protein product [Bubo scandiacus]|uniref:Uncharacterized protein n=1 Tax=Bubo bubo TaxID=30461 RepID=A0A8C0FH22_BUBBB